MFARFLPQTVPFFEFLVQQNALLQEMSEALAVVMDNTEASERHLKRINLLEEEAGSALSEHHSASLPDVHHTHRS